MQSQRSHSDPTAKATARSGVMVEDLERLLVVHEPLRERLEVLPASSHGRDHGHGHDVSARIRSPRVPAAASHWQRIPPHSTENSTLH
eukprot:3398923-Rhodomonas_salina.1